MTEYSQIQRPIFCLPIGIEIEDLHEILNWVFANPTVETILWLTNEQIENFYFQGLWNNIAIVTDNWLIRASEDEWIFSLDKVIRIRENFLNNQFLQDSNVQKIVAILTYAIENKRIPVVFYF